MPLDPLPEHFSSPEEAAEFWERHDTTDYRDSFETVAVEANLERRRFLVELDAELMKALSKLAQERGIGLHEMVTELLRDKTRSAA